MYIILVKTSILLFFIAINSILSVASGQMKQDVNITKVELNYSDDIVYIPYSIVNKSLKGTYFVWVDIFNEKKEKLPSTFLSGDINTVYGSGNKRIAWDIKRDGIVINENIYAVVSAKKMPAANTAKAIAYSTIFPGAGDYQYKKGRPYWIKGLLGYGFLGGSGIMYGNSVKSTMIIWDQDFRLLKIPRSANLSSNCKHL
jgi:hypothetical protein